MRLLSAASPPARYLATVLATVVFGAMLASGARACEQTASKAPAVARAASTARPRAHAPKRTNSAGRPAVTSATPRTMSGWAPGLVIALDPVTGKITRPTPEQMRALTGSPLGASSATPPAPEIVYNADGSAILTLGERYASYATLHKDANGRWVYGCTSDPAPVAPAASSAPSRRAVER